MAKTGRVAMVTGAAQGIGKRTAELLADPDFDGKRWFELPGVERLS